jgi:dipeptide/tripeptide permease
VLGSAAVLAAWSGTSVAVALATRSLLGRRGAAEVVVLGFAVSAAGEFALAGLGVGSSWTRLLPGLVILGIGSGLVNASLGRLALESVPRDRAGMGSGANNTARYLGGAAGVALVVALATGGGAGAGGLLAGWNTAAVVCGALCIVAAFIVATCRSAATRP